MAAIQADLDNTQELEGIRNEASFRASIKNATSLNKCSGHTGVPSRDGRLFLSTIKMFLYRKSTFMRFRIRTQSMEMTLEAFTTLQMEHQTQMFVLNTLSAINVLASYSSAYSRPPVAWLVG